MTRPARTQVNLFGLLSLLFVAGQSQAQTPVQQVQLARQTGEDILARVSDTRYTLGPDDELRITILEAPEPSVERILIDSEGQISLPMTGSVRAAGRTVRELEDELHSKLRAYIHDPSVSVNLLAFRPQTLSVIGAVGRPGVQTIRGPTPLVEVLSRAGGLRADAGHKVTITRQHDQGALLWPPVQETAASQTVQVEVRAIMEARRSEQNLVLLPGDVVSVPRAEMVYVTGSVHQSGGFALEERESLSVIEALALAGGTTKVAAPKRARILRVSTEGRPRTEIAIDLKEILSARASDVHLQRDDILFIPTSGGKIAARHAAEAVIRTATGIAIFAGGRD